MVGGVDSAYQRGTDSLPWGSGQVGQASLSFPRYKMGVGQFASMGGPGGL